MPSIQPHFYDSLCSSQEKTKEIDEKEEKEKEEVLPPSSPVKIPSPEDAFPPHPQPVIAISSSFTGPAPDKPRTQNYSVKTAEVKQPKGVWRPKKGGWSEKAKQGELLRPEVKVWTPTQGAVWGGAGTSSLPRPAAGERPPRPPSTWGTGVNLKSSSSWLDNNSPRVGAGAKTAQQVSVEKSFLSRSVATSPSLLCHEATTTNPLLCSCSPRSTRSRSGVERLVGL